MREILFRGKLTVNNQWIYGNLVKTDMNRYFIFPTEISTQDGHHLNIDSDGCFFVEEYTIGQYTGLNDKNGTKIFEGDIIEIKRADRNYQEHFGDNIPLGYYREPLEPIIKKEVNGVNFCGGMFTLSKEDEEIKCPLVFEFRNTTINSLMEEFQSYKNIWKEDLSCILEYYNLNSEEDLVKYLGISVIGNIYDNPDLLEEK